MCITFIPLTTCAQFRKVAPSYESSRPLYFLTHLCRSSSSFFFVATPSRKQKRKQLSGLPRSDSNIFPLVLQCVHSIPWRPSPARLSSWQGDQTRSSPSGGSADVSSVLPLIQHVVLFFFFKFGLWRSRAEDYCSTWRLSVLLPEALKLFTSSKTNSVHTHGAGNERKDNTLEVHGRVV